MCSVSSHYEFPSLIFLFLRRRLIIYRYNPRVMIVHFEGVRSKGWRKMVERGELMVEYGKASSFSSLSMPVLVLVTFSTSICGPYTAGPALICIQVFPENWRCMLLNAKNPLEGEIEGRLDAPSYA